MKGIKVNAKGRVIAVVEKPRFFIHDESGEVPAGIPLAGWLTREDAESHLACWAKDHHYDVT